MTGARVLKKSRSELRAPVRVHQAPGHHGCTAACHGPWTLIEAGVVEGRTLTPFPSIRTDLRDAGADVVDQDVAVDGNPTTSRSPDDLTVICATIGASFASNSTQEEVMA
ncbi:DJ-1/PfpI family protein [Micrococcus luteus]|uniref:DJ-1/PfpI family protein n=1 Tax=Micrococcus luteus TaxID=1270 RepID=UPI00387A1929